MLARIAAATEARRPPARLFELRQTCLAKRPENVAESIAAVVEHALEAVPSAAVFVPTHSGVTARKISRFKPSVWIVALAKSTEVRRGLAFSYGVVPVDLGDEPDDWRSFAARWLRSEGIGGGHAILVAGPSVRHPEANHRIEFLRLA